MHFPRLAAFQQYADFGSATNADKVLVYRSHGQKSADGNPIGPRGAVTQNNKAALRFDGFLGLFADFVQTLK
jgi:hypothetical protein